MSLENFFPYKPLDEIDYFALTELAGGSPLTGEKLDGFLGHLAVPMLPAGLAKSLLTIGAKECCRVLDTNPERGATMFVNGAHLYAAVLAECSPLCEVPCRPAVFFNITQAEGEEYIFAANDRLRNEVPSFCRFMDDVSDALDLASPIDLKLARAGAGLVHIMATESLRPQEVDDFELEHPELAELEPLFRDLQ